MTKRIVNQQTCLEDAQRMFEAAERWKERHPDAVLAFHQLGYPPNAMVAAALDESLIERVAGNPLTRQLLRTMDDATDNEGTVAQAEACIDLLWGLPRALTVIPGTPATDGTRTCPRCGKRFPDRHPGIHTCYRPK